MQVDTFDDIWENIIIPMTEKIYNLIDDDEKEKVFIRNLPQDKENLRLLYDTTRDTLKQIYHYNNLDKVRKIDIHKVAACFASIIMEYKIFQFKVEEGISDNVFLSNARLAYNISLAIIKDNLLYRYKDDEEKLNYIKSHQLYMPKTTEGHDDFNLGRIKTLMLNDIFLEKFDVLAYSDMLFWIELFNIMILEDNKTIEYVEQKG